MRRYQRKIVTELAEVYQSNDPLKYVYIANKLGINRPMTPREFRIFKKRMFATFKKMGIAAQEAMKNLAGAMTSVASSFASIADAFKKQRTNDLGHINIGSMPQIDISKQMVNHRLYGARVITPEMPVAVRVAPTLEGLENAPMIGGIKDLKITLDEYDGDDHEIRQ